jgi:hypothetical protein
MGRTGTAGKLQKRREKNGKKQGQQLLFIKLKWIYPNTQLNNGHYSYTE